MALMLTGHSEVICAVQRCEYAVSPGNSGDAVFTGGEMSQSFLTGLEGLDFMAACEAGHEGSTGLGAVVSVFSDACFRLDLQRF